MSAVAQPRAAPLVFDASIIAAAAGPEAQAASPDRAACPRHARFHHFVFHLRPSLSGSSFEDGLFTSSQLKGSYRRRRRRDGSRRKERDECAVPAGPGARSRPALDPYYFLIKRRRRARRPYQQAPRNLIKFPDRNAGSILELSPRGRHSFASAETIRRLLS
ncbi:hypothetical protein EVAR_68985_1 [Eumeta japonica]|uniref:Uncharacterized protein n=1 Tax=Eumeta variegata TaxID=151549 RepID=A0A4C1ZXB2_EUMVA|nr:hypothetical protein EVAR_68985_1 [Eumeta japonica]